MHKIMDIASNWDIPKDKEIYNIHANAYKLVCENQKEFYLKVRDNTQKLKHEYELLQYLNDNNIPVSVPIKTKSRELFVTNDKKNYVLYRYISGNHLKSETINDCKKAVKVYGKVLGRFHKALNTYTGNTEHINDMNLSQQIFDWALPIIESQNKYPKIKETVLAIKEDMVKEFEYLPKQLIHRDFHEENLLFEGDELTGIIDFEISMIGYKVYDIVYILTSMLMNNVYNDEFKSGWLQLPRIIIESYLKENKLDECEIKALWYIALSSQLTFIAYAIDCDNKKLLRENLEGFYWIYNNKESVFAF